MKLALFIGLGFLVALDSIAQTAISGIGPFKISVTTTEIIQQLEAELGTNCINIKSSSDFFNERRNSKVLIAELFPDTVNEYMGPSYASFCPQSRVFYVSSYIVSGIELREAYLKFYKDTLYELLCDRTEQLIEAITIKYGEPKKERKNDSVECGYLRSGNTIKLSEYSITEEWRNNSIIAYGTIYNRFNSKCEESINSYFSIYNLDTTTEERYCYEARQKQLEAKKRELKRNKLSDF
jgi:hypothetical protein